MGRWLGELAWAFLFALIIVAGALALWLALKPIPAGAHGDAAWIQNHPSGHVRQCCGKNDCHLLRPEDVVEGPNGYEVLREFTVPYNDHRLRDSETGDYWACIVTTVDDLGSGSSRAIRCLFVPGRGV